MGKRIKIVIDTNILISGFGWGGNPEAILRLVEKGLIENYISNEIFYEVSKVIKYPKLKFTKRIQISIIEFLLIHSKMVKPNEKIQIVINDPSDDKFLECAVEAEVNFIVSGNKHLLEIGDFRNIKIIKPEKFMEIYNNLSH